MQHVLDKPNIPPNLINLIANITGHYLPLFAAFDGLSKLVVDLANQYKALKVKIKMSRGFWELIQFSLNHLDFVPELRSDLELFLKPTGPQTPMPPDITTLSPMSEIMAPDSHYSQELSNVLRELNIVDDISGDRSLSHYFTIISSRFMDSCRTQQPNDDSNADIATPSLIATPIAPAAPISPTSISFDDCRKLVKVMQLLRDIDAITFNDLLAKWLREKVEPELMYDSNTFSRILLMLVVYECISLDRLAEIFLQIKSIELPGSSVTCKIMIDLIASENVQDIELLATERVSLDIQRQVFERTSAATFAKCVFDILSLKPEGIKSSDYDDDVDGPGTGSPPSACNDFHDKISNFILFLSNNDLNILMPKLVEPILKAENTFAIQRLRSTIHSLLRIPNPATGELKHDIIQLFQICNDFNVKLCQIQMCLLLYRPSTNQDDFVMRDLDGPDGGYQGETSSEVLNATEELSGNFKSTAEIVLDCLFVNSWLSEQSKWAFADLLIYLDAPAKSQILTRAQLMFLQSAQFPRVVDNDDRENNSKEPISIVPFLLEIIEAIADSDAEDICKQHSFDISNCLKILVHLSETAEQGAGKNQGPSLSSSPSVDDIRTGILLFVKIVMIHCVCLQTVPELAVLRQSIISGLLTLLESSLVMQSPDLYGLLVDVVNIVKGSSGESTIVEDDEPSLCTRSMEIIKGLDHSQSSTYGAWDDSQFLSTDDCYLNDLVLFNKQTYSYSELEVRSFDLLEESNPTMASNDVALNLALFDSATTQKNPV